MDVCWSPALGIYCGISSGGGVSFSITSSDGITWSAENTITGVTSGASSIAWSPKLGLFCVLGDSTQLSTSPDGINWTARTGAQTQNDWGIIVWSTELEVFCAVPGINNNPIGTIAAQTSDDGINWTLGNNFPAFDSLTGLAWSPQLSLFCAVAQQKNDASFTNSSWTSPTGVTWTQHANMPASKNFRGLSWNGTVFCTVAGGTSTPSTLAVTSADGMTWNSQTLPASKAWRAISWNGHVFATVAGGSYDIDTGVSAGDIGATSPDGADWTQRTLPDQPWAALTSKLNQ